MRLHVTSGTTGDPVAIGLTRADHEANSAIGGAAFAIAGVRDSDVIAHCLNYALYAGGIADHMALEASGATVVPVGVGQSQRLLDLIPRLGLTAIYGTLSFPAHLAGRAREAGIDPAALGLRHIVTAGEPGAGLGAVRAQIEATWGASVADSFGMSDVWSTMAGECEARQGLHLTTDGWAILELVEPGTGRPAGARGRRLRRARVDPPAPRGLAAAALSLGRPRARVDVAVRLRAQRHAHPHRGPRRRHAARAGGQRAPRRDRGGARALRRAGPLRGGGRRRPDRPAAARLRGDGERDRGGRRGAARRAGRALRGTGGGAGDAAGGRAEDARRVPHGARRGAGAPD